MADPVFVVGCDRSGTTMLRLMLNRSPSVFIPAESGFIPELGQRHDYGDFANPDARRQFVEDLKSARATSRTSGFGVFEFSENDIEALVADIAPATYPEVVSRLFEAAASREGKSGWGDKTPRYVRHIDWLAEAFPRARFVHIIRDGRDVAASLRRAGWVKYMGEGADFWKSRVTAGRSSGLRLGPDRYREIRYEELVNDPRNELKALSYWLGIDYAPEMLEFNKGARQAIPPAHHDLFEHIEKPPMASRILAWKSEMDRADVAEFQYVAGELLEELGYELADGTPSFQVRVRCRYQQARRLVERTIDRCRISNSH